MEKFVFAWRNAWQKRFLFWGSHNFGWRYSDIDFASDNLTWKKCKCFGRKWFPGNTKIGTVNLCFYVMVWVVFNSGLLWSLYISRLSDLVARSGFGCFREFSSGFGKSNFAFMIVVIVELHLERELNFGREE